LKQVGPSTLASHTASLNNPILAFLSAFIPTKRRPVFHFSINPICVNVPLLYEAPPWPRWLLDAVGIDRLSNVIRVFAGLTITDADMASVGPLTHLEELSLKATQVTDEGLPHLQGLSRLKSLELGSNTITGADLLPDVCLASHLSTRCRTAA
jgi:hypothetical protein